MSNKAWLNVLLALLLLGLLALAIYEPGERPAVSSERLTTLPAETVQRLRIENAGRPPLILQKQQGQWRMLSPFDAPANGARIKALLQVMQARSIARYPMSQVDVNQLKLDVPALVLRIDDTVLRFGGTAALGGSRYVQTGNEVRLITDRYTHLARGAATDFISPLLLPMHNGDKIVALDVPGLRLENSGGHWLANGEPVAGDARQRLLDQWRRARALRVGLLAAGAGETPETEVLRIRLMHEGTLRTIHFGLRRTESESILQRLDLGLQYHLPADVAQHLFTLPESVP